MGLLGWIGFNLFLLRCWHDLDSRLHAEVLLALAGTAKLVWDCWAPVGSGTCSDSMSASVIIRPITCPCGFFLICPL
jgi:hypothetical protein